MNSLTSVDQMQDSENAVTPASPGSEQRNKYLPPEQVLGLLTLVASLRVIHTGRRDPSAAIDTRFSLESMIDHLDENESGRNRHLTITAPVQAPLSEDFHPGHPGIDYAAVTGSPVVTVMDGLVTFSGWNNSGYGNLIIVENGRMQAWYAHLSQLEASVGRVVKSGDLIGASGSSGFGTGAHLHFEIRLDGIPIDPARYFDQGSIIEETV